MTVAQANATTWLSDMEVLVGLIAPHTTIKPADYVKAHAVWDAAGGTWIGMYQMAADHMTSIVGAAATRRLMMAFDTGRRKCVEGIRKIRINEPHVIADLLMLEMSHLQTEHLRVVVLDTKKHILKIVTIGVGCINSTPVRVAEVFCEAIKLNADAIILVHNHPSGDPTPSPEDVTVTRRIIQAGDLLNIHVADHIVIGYARWVSMREHRFGW